MRNELDYWGNDAPKCPHCEKEQSQEFWMAVSTDDGDLTNITCEYCNQDFVTQCEVTHKWHSATDWDRACDEEWGPDREVEEVA